MSFLNIFVSIFLLGSFQNFTRILLFITEQGIKIIFSKTTMTLQIPLKIYQNNNPKKAKKA
jgi:hypothetical protein